MFDTGPQFVFNLGGGPGIRVHQFGGNRPRRRPREANANGAEERPQNLASTLAGLLPLLILFILPLLSSLFSSGDSTPSGPQIRFTGPQPPFTIHRQTPNLKVDYFVNPADVADYSNYKFRKLDERAEVARVQQLRVECESEIPRRQRINDEAQGWFFQDEAKMQQARTMELRSCAILNEMGVGLR
jgi:DnaJ family protein B protein 12